MAVSFGIASWNEGGVISAVSVLNIVVGFSHEHSAEETIYSLRSLRSPTATVVRDGQPEVVPTAKIVCGDVVEVKSWRYRSSRHSVRTSDDQFRGVQRLLTLF